MKNVTLLALALAFTCLAACKDKEKEAPKEKKAAQSLAEAMALICGAVEQPDVMAANPAERQRMIAEWIDAHVTNKEARALFTAVGSANPSDAFRMLDEAARRAGLADCAMTRPGDPLAKIPVPDVGAVVLEPIPAGALALIATPDAIVLEGNAIVALRDHEIDPAELEGGRGGHLIPKVRRYLDNMPRPGDTVLLLLHPKTPYRVLYALVSSVKDVLPKIHLVARGAAGTGTVQLTIPAAAPSAPPAQPAVGMVVAVTATKSMVFSLSGTEGTLGLPLVEAPTADAAVAIRKTLAEVVERHWSGGAARPAREQEIVLMADDGVPAQDVVSMIAAMRESFPEVVLGRGFE